MRPHDRETRIAMLLIVLAALLAGCGLGGVGGPGPTTVPGPSIQPGATLDPGDLRLRLIDRFGPRWYCDPDVYPISRATDEATIALQRFPDMQAEGVVFGAVVRHLGLAGVTSFSDAQKLALYQLWKVAVSIALDPLGGGRYRFDYLARPPAGGSLGTETAGTIDSSGAISIESTASAGAPMCPICLARGTPIDTPAGPIAVERLLLGERVWTLDLAGRRVAGVVIALGSTVAPPDHRVIRLVLADGRAVTASLGHPLADGRRLGDLRVGDVVEGSLVVSVDSLPYGGGETFDLVVSGPTGIYLSDGIPLGSTLR